jgi:hypothetical protein
MQSVHGFDFPAALLVAAATLLVPLIAMAQPAAYTATQRCDEACRPDPEVPPPDDRLAPPARPPAPRGWAVGADLSGLAFVPGGGPLNIAVDGRLGYRFRFPRYFVVPEIAAGYLGLPGGGSGARLGRVGGGVRVGIDPAGSLLETSFFSHTGVLGGTWGAIPYTDLGVALDLRAGRHFSAGAHLAWNIVVSAPTWGGIGVSSLLLFGAHAWVVL